MFHFSEKTELFNNDAKIRNFASLVTVYLIVLTGYDSKWLGTRDKKQNPSICWGLQDVPEAGIEPALPKELDFESSASTSSATRAL